MSEVIRDLKKELSFFRTDKFVDPTSQLLIESDHTINERPLQRFDPADDSRI